MLHSLYSIIIIIYPLTAKIVGAPQMISQPVPPISPCFPLPSGTWRTPGLSIPWCCLPTSFLCLPCLFPLLLCLARWFWSDVMNGRCVHTTAVCDWLLDLGTDCTVQSSDYAADVVVSKLVQMGVNFFIRLFSCCQYVFSLSSKHDLFSVPQWYFETLFRSWYVLTV